MSIQEIHHSVHPAIQASPKRRRASRPSRARVLIVDDIAENRMVLAMFCEQFGMTHECVEGGREAVEAARSGRFDAILMDIFMPHMDGMIATRAIRELAEPIASTPIIAVTTAAEPGEVKRYLACGMTDVVAKPILAARLLEALSAALAERRRARKALARASGADEEVRLSA
jgi:two-component system, sensor histidine kinase